jgi:hypothetical protein
MSGFCDACKVAASCPYLRDYGNAPPGEDPKLCPPFEVLIGKPKSQRERPMSDILAEDADPDTTELSARDYKLILAEDADARNVEHSEKHDRIMDMPHATFEETRRKLIAAGAFFAIPSEMTALVLKVHSTTINRTAKRTHPVKITISDG